MSGQNQNSDNPGAKPGGRSRRRNYLINPLFQVKYTLSLAIGAFLVSCFLGICMFGFMYQEARHKAIDPLSTSVWENSTVIFLFALVYAVMVLVVLGAWGVVVTHRISGPLYVLFMNLKKMQSGRFPAKRNLRKKDEFKALHAQFFTTADAIRERMSNARDTVADAVKGIEASGARDSLSSVVADLKSLRDELSFCVDDDGGMPSAPAESRKAEASC